MSEMRIQETKRNLNKFLKELTEILEESRPLIKHTKLARLVYNSEKRAEFIRLEEINCNSHSKSSPSPPPSQQHPQMKVHKSFDLTRCIADCFEILMEKNKFNKPIEFLASITRREQLPCLWAIVCDEQRLQ